MKLGKEKTGSRVMGERGKGRKGNKEGKGQKGEKGKMKSRNEQGKAPEGGGAARQRTRLARRILQQLQQRRGDGSLRQRSAQARGAAQVEAQRDGRVARSRTWAAAAPMGGGRSRRAVAAGSGGDPFRSRSCVPLCWTSAARIRTVRGAWYGGHGTADTVQPKTLTPKP